MGRRRKSDSNEFFNGLLEILLAVPWFVGPLIALLVFLAFRFLIPALIPSVTGTDVSAQMDRGTHPIYRGVSVFIAPWAAGVVVFVWLVAEGKKIGQRRIANRQSELISAAPQNETSVAPRAGAQGPPTCPQCGSPMVRRTAKRGPTPGSEFWGCSQFPKNGCRGTREVT